jgi:hypothetical protein
MPVKRYVVFRCESYYAGGGWSDFKGSADILEEAITMARDGFDEAYEWWHVVDLADGSVVAGSASKAYGGLNVDPGKVVR